MESKVTCCVVRFIPAILFTIGLILSTVALFSGKYFWEVMIFVYVLIAIGFVILFRWWKN